MKDRKTMVRKRSDSDSYSSSRSKRYRKYSDSDSTISDTDEGSISSDLEDSRRRYNDMRKYSVYEYKRNSDYGK